MQKSFRRYKWTSLLSFALMYNFVYLGRFNVNYLIQRISGDLVITASQQELISLSVFLSYAAGSFINGYLADRFGARRIVILGGVMTSLLNLCVALQHSWLPILILWLVNGYFQSMIWVGGISLLANWWKQGERGKGVAVANFFSGMSHATAYVLPVMFFSLWPAFTWRMNFIVPILILLAFVGLFALFAKERPEDVGQAPYEITNRRHQQREETLLDIRKAGKKPWNHFFSQPNFWWWCAIAMLSSICRYGLLDWIPLYFSEESGTPFLSETFSNLTLPMGMAVGTLVITWVAGTRMFDNKGIIITAMAALCGTLVVTFPMIGSTQAVLVGIFFTGFVLYGINGVLWVHAIDQGCRVFAGSAAGIFNGFAYFGALLQNFLFPAVLRVTGSYLSIFVVMEILCIFMVVCGMMISKKNTSVVPEVRD